jgi:hypothetical protein
LHRLVKEAIRLGANALEVEHRDGHEEVVAMKGAIGAQIARLPNGAEAARLRSELDSLVRRKQRLNVDGVEWELRDDTYENFGELVFRVRFRGGKPA